MNVEFPALTLPPQTELKIELSITASINVTAQTVQRKVSKLLLDELGNLLYGEIPSSLPRKSCIGLETRFFSSRSP